MSHMDMIVVLQHGRIIDCRPYEEIKPRLAGAIKQKATLEPMTASSDGYADLDDRSSPETPQNPRPANQKTVSTEEDGLRRRYGSWSVYRYYLRSAGSSPVFLWMSFTLTGAVASSMISKFP